MHIYIHYSVCVRDNRIDFCRLAASPVVIATSCELVFALHYFVFVSAAVGVRTYVLMYLLW
jgi:hypothetical protein